MGYSPLSSVFTSSTVQIHCTECGTEPILYVTLHFLDRRGAASLCYRNRSEITVNICEQKPYAV